MDKQIIRKHMIQVLKDMSRKSRKIETDLIMQQLVMFISERGYKHIAYYFGETPEIQTPAYYDKLIEIGCQIYLPRVEKNRQMTFRKFDIDQIERSKLGVIQPTHSTEVINSESLDLLIVPGLAYNKQGFRIGFGGGYYDRFLVKNPNIPTCSLVFSKQMINNIDFLKETHDQLVETLILKDQILSTGG